MHETLNTHWEGELLMCWKIDLFRQFQMDQAIKKMELRLSWYEGMVLRRSIQEIKDLSQLKGLGEVVEFQTCRAKQQFIKRWPIVSKLLEHIGQEGEICWLYWKILSLVLSPFPIKDQAKSLTFGAIFSFQILDNK